MLDMSLNRQTVFTCLVVILFGVSGVEIILEFLAGESFDAMLDDMSRFLLSLILLSLFVFEYRDQQKALQQTRESLKKAHGQLAQLNAQTTVLGCQYRAIMQQQFDAWHLTTSEQDIVIAMLKGLSLREIADMRETREKTVRQQASSIYTKAGVSGRHELAAWFFEDILDPVEDLRN